MWRVPSFYTGRTGRVFFVNVMSVPEGRRGVAISGLTGPMHFSAEECDGSPHPHLPALALTPLTSARRCKFREVNTCGGILPDRLYQQHQEAPGGGVAVTKVIVSSLPPASFSTSPSPALTPVTHRFHWAG